MLTPRARPRAAAAALMPAWTSLLLAGLAIGALVTGAHPASDASAVAQLRGEPQSVLTGLMRAITWLGSPLPLDIAFAAGLLILLVGRCRRDVTRPLGLHLTPADGPSWRSGPRQQLSNRTMR